MGVGEHRDRRQLLRQVVVEAMVELAKYSAEEKMRVRLTVPSGGLVTEAEVPPFNQPPDVLLWGSRVFRFLRLDDGVAVYVEAFAFTVPA